MRSSKENVDFYATSRLGQSEPRSNKSGRTSGLTVDKTETKLYSCFRRKLVPKWKQKWNPSCRAQRIATICDKIERQFCWEKHENKTVTKIVRTPDSVSKSTHHHPIEYPSSSKTSTIACSLRELSSSHKLYHRQSCKQFLQCCMWIPICFFLQLVGTRMTNPTNHKQKKTGVQLCFCFVEL
jgi:hypothetical protein